VGTFADDFDRLLPYAYNVGWRLCRDRQLAEDVAQETLTRAYVRWGRISRHPNPEGWVVTTAVNVAREFIRKRRPVVLPSPPAALSLGGDPFAHPELVDALGHLSRRQRAVFVYRHAFDFSVEETGAELGLTTSQVKDATHEARQKLLRLLAPKETASL
jgi:DNA-directed RNA polymerase specialized sigma24 family protein